MKFRKLRTNLLRLNLERDAFYEDVIFENKFICDKAKKIVAEWMNCLQYYKQIRVKKFKDLFSELHEIVFPITIKESYSSWNLDFYFIDNEGKKYYMLKSHIYDYDTMETYIIVRRDNPLEPLIDREFSYKISKDKTILLMDISAMKLKPNGENDDMVVNFYYNSVENTTEAILKSYSSKNIIKIKYSTMTDEFDKMVLKFLFSINGTTCYYYNVFPILQWIEKVISNREISISIIAEMEEKVYSEIEIVKNNVQKYTITKIINEGEMHIVKKILAKDLKEFLAENG